MKNNTLTLITLLVSTFTFACSCEWGGNFLRASKYAELIVAVEIVDAHYNFVNGETVTSKNINQYPEDVFVSENEYYTSLKVQVIKVIKGAETRHFFEIYGTDGADCRESLYDFKIGQKLILNLYQSTKDDRSQPNEDEEDYSLWGCSENWLEYDENKKEVKGYIKGKRRRSKRVWDYDKLLEKIL